MLPQISRTNFFIISYFILTFTMFGFAFTITQWNFATFIIIIPAFFFYPSIYLLPSILITYLFFLLTLPAKIKKWRNLLLNMISLLTVIITEMLLITDLAIFNNFGFHFNPLIWNLVTTQGGLESMGLRKETLIPLAFFGLILTTFFIIIFLFSKKIGKLLQPIFLHKKKIIAIFIVLTVTSKIVYSYEFFMLRSVPLMAVNSIPGYRDITMRKFFRKIGLKPVNRDQILVKNAALENYTLDYPQEEVKRDLTKKKYNIVWLACESLRFDMLDVKIMPESYKFAKKTINFKEHYSGGNGTRQGMFTMFYGLYGNYWDAFLKTRRSPVFIDWLIEDKYDFYCLTSAKFTYPEFDSTIFSAVSSKSLSSYYQGHSWQRDRYNTTRLIEYLKKTKKGNPFMAFMFFESTHAPYEFPPECNIYKNALPSMNYTTITAKDGPRIFSRYKNSAYHLDTQLAKIFKTLEEEKLMEDTIIILVGDHGEEFYEKGRLGHNSEFVQEQIKTPLLIYIPQVKAREYTKMSSHLDVIPTLAPFFGVKSPAEDFSLGYNLLDEKNQREYCILADWQSVFYLCDKFKTYLPNSMRGYALQKLTDKNDNPLPDLDVFYQEKYDDILQIQKDMTKFLR